MFYQECRGSLLSSNKQQAGRYDTLKAKHSIRSRYRYPKPCNEILAYLVLGAPLCSSITRVHLPGYPVHGLTGSMTVSTSLYMQN